MSIRREAARLDWKSQEQSAESGMVHFHHHVTKTGISKNLDALIFLGAFVPWW